MWARERALVVLIAGRNSRHQSRMHDVRSDLTATSQPPAHRRAPGSVTNRSKITNNPWALPGVDNRLPLARRFRDLCREFAGDARLNEAERAQVRQAAMLTMRAEALQVAQARGELVIGDEAIRLSSEIRRILAPIAAKASAIKQNEPPQTLKEYHASRAAEKATAA